MPSGYKIHLFLFAQGINLFCYLQMSEHTVIDIISAITPLLSLSGRAIARSLMNQSIQAILLAKNWSCIFYWKIIAQSLAIQKL
ncbi:hypothetical protein CDG77_04450 [Nostoc sp. 'Peltigera membranacea cyanobiont' 213]|nr:hypothetical protein CDG77_04450 [Nostoc sp. 'Peltigera membranacea cyanobiont' 213]